MNASGTARRLLVDMVVVVLLAGCGAGASPTPTTFGPATVVTGRATCPGMAFDFTTDADGTKHIRDDYVANRCTVTTDDPRVSGSRSSTQNQDLWKRLGVNHELVQWGTQRLENDGGAWEGRFTGAASRHGGDFIVNWYKGTGGYAGLAYFELITGFEPFPIHGQIFPGNPPPPYAEEATGSGRPVDGGPVADEAVAKVTGTHACPGMEPDWTTDPDGTMHFRDYALECTDTTDDPRVSGSHTASANMDVWGTLDAGAGDQWRAFGSRMPGEPGKVAPWASPPCPDVGTPSWSGTRGPATTPGCPTSS